MQGTWSAAVKEIKATAGTALWQSDRGNTLNGELGDGVGVFAQRPLAAGEEVMGLAWPEQRGSCSQGLIKVTEADLLVAGPPEHVLWALRRRFWRDPGSWQAVPVNLQVFHYMSQQQFLNEAETEEEENVRYDPGEDRYVTLQEIGTGTELLLARGTSPGSKPGAGAAHATSAAEAKEALKWAGLAPPVRLGRSAIHGVGVIAATRIAKGEKFQMSASQVLEMTMHGRSRATQVPHTWVMRDLDAVEARYVRDHFVFDGFTQAVPQQGGCNRLVMYQFTNHADGMVYEDAVSFDKGMPVKKALMRRELAAGAEVTEDLNQAGCELYYRVMVANPQQAIAPWELPVNVKEVESQAHEAQDEADPNRDQEACSLPGCQNKGDNMCSRCHKALYCSRDCQRAHWKQHKKMCCLK